MSRIENVAKLYHFMNLGIIGGTESQVAKLDDEELGALLKDLGPLEGRMHMARKVNYVLKLNADQMTALSPIALGEYLSKHDEIMAMRPTLKRRA